MSFLCPLLKEKQCWNNSCSKWGGKRLLHETEGRALCAHKHTRSCFLKKKCCSVRHGSQQFPLQLLLLGQRLLCCSPYPASLQAPLSTNDRKIWFQCSLKNIFAASFAIWHWLRDGILRNEIKWASNWPALITPTNEREGKKYSAFPLQRIKLQITSNPCSCVHLVLCFESRSNGFNEGF